MIQINIWIQDMIKGSFTTPIQSKAPLTKNMVLPPGEQNERTTQCWCGFVRSQSPTSLIDVVYFHTGYTVHQLILSFLPHTQTAFCLQNKTGKNLKIRTQNLAYLVSNYALLRFRKVLKKKIIVMNTFIRLLFIMTHQSCNVLHWRQMQSHHIKYLNKVLTYRVRQNKVAP